MIFLTVFFFIYSAIHTFCYFRLRVLLPDLPLVRIMIIFFMIGMIILPVVARFLEHNEYDGLARITAITGFTWMGLILFLFWGTLALTIALCSLAQFLAYPWSAESTGFKRLLDGKIAFQSAAGIRQIDRRQDVHRPGDYWKTKAKENGK